MQAFCPGPTDSNFHQRAGGGIEQIPKFLHMTSGSVAEEFMKNLRKRKGPVVVPGRLNRFCVLIAKVLGLKIMAWFEGIPKMSRTN